MTALPYSLGRIFVGRLRMGADLFEEITRVANEYNIVTGTVSGIGKIKHGTLAILNHTKKEYEEIRFDHPMEITSLDGNISRMKHRAFPHVHVSMSDSDGRVFGGHLVQGCEIWLCEIVIQELLGGTLTRDFDETTGLPLWNKDSIL